QLYADLARHVPAEIMPGEMTGGLAAYVNGERRRRLMEELLRVVVGEDDPEIRLQGAKLFTNPRRDIAHGLDDVHVFRVGQREKLWRMRQHRATNDGTLHRNSPVSAALLTRL